MLKLFDRLRCKLRVKVYAKFQSILIGRKRLLEKKCILEFPIIK